MTTYLLTEAQRDDLNAALQIPEHVGEDEHKKAIAMLQSLPEVQPTVTHSAPVAYRQKRLGTNKHWIYGLFEINPDYLHEFEPLYTSPQALTQQIGMEAADFAGWLVEHVEQEIIYEERLTGWLGKWLKHRSEA